MAGRARDPESKRRAILDAAEALFSQHGFRATATSAIGDQAGVSEGIIFHHFGNKVGVLRACATDQAASLIESLRPVGGEPIDYEAMAAAVFEWVANHPMLRPVIAEGDDQVLAALRRGWERGIVPVLTELLADEQRAGRCVDRDPATLARMQFALMSEALTINHEPNTTREPIEAPEIARYLAALTRS